MILILIIAIIGISVILLLGHRKKLLKNVLNSLNLNLENIKLSNYDDQIIVKSHQALDNYNDIKYFKERNNLDYVKNVLINRIQIKNNIDFFLKNNNYSKDISYNYVKKQLTDYSIKAHYYRVSIVYITTAGNNRGENLLIINLSRVNELISHPEFFMSKGEYNRILKQQDKDKLNSKKQHLYDKVNEIIDYANNYRDRLIVKSQVKNLDDLIQKLFNNTVNNIQRVKSVDSNEWKMLEEFITTIENKIKTIIQEDKKISDYYNSDEFLKLKETCAFITKSQKEFNEYIDKKAQSISLLFGRRIVRNETENQDINNYIRAYKKNITPFTVEVSSAVFGSAENNPIGYIIKYFYPNKSQYNEQIEKLRLLIEELETLKDAKLILDNYKKDYKQYIQNVPNYVLKNDEEGFYSRLGMAVIDESVLNVEYRFVYTSNGGMAQRSFSVPMNEENITELINQLETKSSLNALVKEQRALMTSKLRTYIKERDNYTCCQCGNSVYAEPNLLLEIDHIIPVSKGGLTQEDNLQTLCWKCNREKGAKIIL